MAGFYSSFQQCTHQRNCQVFLDFFWVAVTCRGVCFRDSWECKRFSGEKQTNRTASLDAACIFKSKHIVFPFEATLTGLSRWTYPLTVVVRSSCAPVEEWSFLTDDLHNWKHSPKMEYGFSWSYSGICWYDLETWVIYIHKDKLQFVTAVRIMRQRISPIG